MNSKLSPVRRWERENEKARRVRVNEIPSGQITKIAGLCRDRNLGEEQPYSVHGMDKLSVGVRHNRQEDSVTARD